MTPFIKVTKLQRYYSMGENTVKALDGADLTIDQGEFVMVVGSSGSGKSTLMHIIGLLDTATGGSFKLNGQEITTLSDDQRSSLRNEKIGFVFQKFNLLPDLTVLENIALPLSYEGIPKEQRQARAKKYAARMGLADRLHHRPTELSGGQNQRVAIARALVTEPDIIMGDEPTGALDSKTGKEIMQILHELNEEGKTIIMVTHDPVLAEQGTRKISIKDGHIIGDEPGKKTLKKSDESSANKPEVPGSFGLSFKDLFIIGLREGLLPHKMRTFLTMLGIIIGVASVIAMSSFSLGSKKKQADQIRALGANMIKVIDSKLESDQLLSARTQGSNGLSLNDLELIKQSIPAITKSAVLREVKLNVHFKQQEINPRILGIAGDYLTVNNIELAQGRSFDNYDQDSSNRVAIIGANYANKFNTKMLGENIFLSGIPYRIIAIMANKNIDLKGLEAGSENDPNSDLLIPLESLTARTQYLERRSEIDEIQVQLSDEDQLSDAGTAIKKALINSHAGLEDFRLVIPLDLLKQKQQSQKLLDILTICIASISILVGGIGIMNIMLATVNERIKEIGVRRAVGATKRDILYQFLAESVIISVVGGAIGVVFAACTVFFVCYLLGLPVVFSVPLTLTSVIASIATGLGFGLYPAGQAAAKDPVEALE